MKTERLVSALKKVGIEVSKEQRKIYDHFEGDYKLSTPKYEAIGKKYKVNFFDQGGSVVCCHVMHKDAEDDIRNDNSPGFFAKTIKLVIKYLTQ